MNRRLVAVLSLLAAVFAAAAFFAGGFYTGLKYEKSLELSRVPPPTSLGKEFDILGEVVDSVNQAYVEEIPRKKLVDGAIQGVIRSLKDPYTRYLSKTHFKSFREETTGKFGGVGMELGTRNSSLVVVAPIKGTPAEKAGVTAGDTILMIDKRSTRNMPIQTAVKLIRGKPGTKVRLKLKREDGEIYQVSLTRAEIKLPNVSARMLDGDLGYVNVHTFSENTGDDVKKEVKDLMKKGAKGIILDLRNNPGGLLNEAVSLAGVFIDSGPIVGVKERDGQVSMIRAPGGAIKDIPLVVLVNKGSASASEIVAGAIQDRKRGTVVGETTFGKGSVQTVVPLSGGNGLLLTTAKYQTPKGRSLHKVGTKPDIFVKLSAKTPLLGKDDAQLNRAKEELRSLIED